RRMPPADAKRVSCRIGVHLVALLGVEVGRLEQSGAEPDRRFVRSSWIFDMKVEMYLLRSPIRPVGRNVVRRQLHADVPLTGGIDDAVKAVVSKDLPAEDLGPEGALSIHIGGVEHDYVTHQLHFWIVPSRVTSRPIKRSSDRSALSRPDGDHSRRSVRNAPGR